MKRINLKTITNALSSKEMKAVMGGGNDIGNGICIIRCYFGDEGHSISDCSDESIQAYGCPDLYKLICACTGS